MTARPNGRSSAGIEGFMPRPVATRGQTLLGAFCILVLAAAFAASATVTLACAGPASCRDGAVSAQAQAAPPTSGLQV